MPAAEATAQTSNASRYLTRLCQHAGKMHGRLGHQPRRHATGDGPPEIHAAEWSGTSGSLIMSLGRCTLRASDGMLTIRAEASSEADLQRIQLLVTKRLEGFGRRERLTLTWQPAPDLPARPETGSLAPSTDRRDPEPT